MTIRLEKTNGTTYANSRGVRLVIQSTVAVDTEAEALAAQRAFETVLAPRFTRDEAIAIVKAYAVNDGAFGDEFTGAARAHYLAGIRLALEALAAAGVFVDQAPEREPLSAEDVSAAATMADKLDAAGIR